MSWLWSLLGWRPDSYVPPEDDEDAARRETDLRRRLERLTYEVEVTQRDNRSEEPRW